MMHSYYVAPPPVVPAGLSVGAIMAIAVSVAVVAGGVVVVLLWRRKRKRLLKNSVMPYEEASE